MMITLLLSAFGANCMMRTRRIVNCSFQFEEHMTSERSETFQKQLKAPTTLCRGGCAGSSLKLKPTSQRYDITASAIRNQNTDYRLSYIWLIYILLVLLSYFIHCIYYITVECILTLSTSSIGKAFKEISLTRKMLK